MTEKVWTETYHSWQEYEAKHPDWNKHLSSRIGAAFARAEIERTESYTGHYFCVDWNSPENRRVHRDVESFLKKLHEAEKTSRHSKLRFDVTLSSC
jgi:hypothetical protein